MDMGYYKEIADMVAFGWASTNSEREAHFDLTKALHRRGTLTRNMACIDLVELGLRNASGTLTQAHPDRPCLSKYTQDIALHKMDSCSTLFFILFCFPFPT
jgi:hypothetical protein